MNSILTKQNIVVGGVTTLLKKEEYSSVNLMARDLKSRKVTDDRFDDKETENSSGRSWSGGITYNDAMKMLTKGYEPTTKKLKETLKLSLKKMTASEKRIRFEESVEGFQPIVPLAIMNVPTSMLDVKIKNIKAKVINIFYNCSFISDKSSEDIIALGQQVFETIIRLESCGYRFNLYVVNEFCDTGDNDIDMLIVKIKSSNQVLDIRKMSFPLTHTAFARILGFSWLEKTPNGKYKGYGYGKTLDRYMKIKLDSKEERDEFLEKVFGKNAVLILGNDILDRTHNAEERQKEIIEQLKGRINKEDVERMGNNPQPKPKKEFSGITPEMIKTFVEGDFPKMPRGFNPFSHYFDTPTSSGSDSPEPYTVTLSNTARFFDD